MKRWFSVLFLLTLCVLLIGCSKQLDAAPGAMLPAEKPQQTETPTVPQPPVTTPEEPAPAEPLPEEPSTPVIPEMTTSHHDAGFKDQDNVNDVLSVKAALPNCETLPKINTYYQALWDDFYASCQLTWEDALTQKADFAAAGLEFLPWTLEISSEVARNDGVTLSVIRTIYENTGGMHPSITYKSETFDIASQGRLLLSNLFTVPEAEYFPRLQEMILAQMDKRETEDGIYYYDFAREELMTLLDPMDFVLTEDSLQIFFNVYTLAPYAAGPQQFSLPLSDLADIVKPQYLTE